ncbi:HU family DNA-binding protein [uncultured Bacteroides sp.]|uniref:HU family DNA-binding protein n=1 Tax=uncultured Bacteroides sp. TaxID=162156 RepID=UPI0025F846FD|nr:HU family DNA-binding protein [uncultured Bacteroides sp.]
MNERLNIQNLVRLLAEKHDMDRQDAESFVKEFFQLIEEALEADKYVKIKGFGTFKLINVESRESVNINTGERFRIQGHTKVSFTPEPVLKDLINKPFSFFETVVLNDSTVLEDTQVESLSEEDAVMEELIGDIAPETGVGETAAKKCTEEITVTDEPVDVVSKSSPVEAEPTVVETISQSVEPIIEMSSEPAKKSEELLSDTRNSHSDAEGASTIKIFMGIVIVVIALCAGSVIFMYYPDILNENVSFVSDRITEMDTTVDSTDSLVQKDTARVAKTDTLSETVIPKVATAEPMIESKTIATVSTESIAKKEAPVMHKEVKKKTVAIPSESDSVNYKIVGTKATYTIKEGETLTKVALRFYGSKAFWPYIVKYNSNIIKNPDHVPYGTVVKIPELVKK